MEFGLYQKSDYAEANLKNIKKGASSDITEIANFFLRKTKEQYYKIAENVFIHGAHRVGKTWLLHAIANYVINEYKERSIYFISSEQLNKHFFKKDTYKHSDDTWISYLASKKILLLDDIGQDNYTSTDFIPKRLDAFLRWRFNHNLITFISSNFEIEELKVLYNESMCEFIMGEYIEYQIIGKNMSEKIKGERINELAKGRI